MQWSSPPSLDSSLEESENPPRDGVTGVKPGTAVPGPLFLRPRLNNASLLLRIGCFRCGRVKRVVLGEEEGSLLRGFGCQSCCKVRTSWCCRCSGCTAAAFSRVFAIYIYSIYNALLIVLPTVHSLLRPSWYIYLSIFYEVFRDTR